MALFIAVGVDLYFLTNLFNLFDISQHRANDDFTTDYNQGFSGINVDFRMTHHRATQFNSILIYQTISSENVEEIGITNISYNVFIDSELFWYNDLDYAEPVMYEYDSFVLNGIHLNNNISCTGVIDAQFYVEGIVQNETINFALSIIMPAIPIEELFWYITWLEIGLFVFLIVIIGLIFKIIRTLTRENKYKKDEYL